MMLYNIFMLVSLQYASKYTTALSRNTLDLDVHSLSVAMMGFSWIANKATGRMETPSLGLVWTTEVTIILKSGHF